MTRFTSVQMGDNHREISLKRAPDAQVLVIREKASMYVWRLKRGEYVRSKFPIGVGRLGDETPSGAYYIDAKSREPSWWVPKHEDYDPALWGTEIPFDSAENPFAGGFLSISGGEGIGIHGVRFDPELTRTGYVSHGCVRVSVKALERLYFAVPLGSPVIIL